MHRSGVAVAALAGVLAACGGEREAALAEQVLAGMSLRSQVAQLFVAEMPDTRGLAASAADSVAIALREQFEQGGPGALLVEGGTAEDLSRSLRLLGAAGPVPPLVAVRLERGLGGTISGATELPPLASVAGRAGPDRLRQAGRIAGREARSMGIHLGMVEAVAGPLDAWLLEPHLAGVRAYLEGLGAVGIGVAASVFEAPEDSGSVLRLWDRSWLESAELPLLREAVDAGTAAIVLRPLVVPALSGDTAALPFAPVVAQGLLRRDLGFSGLIMAELRGPAAGPVAAVRALAAGADLLIGVGDVAEAIDTVVAAIQTGRLGRHRVDEASRRLLRVKASAGLLGRARPARPRLGGRLAERVAQELFTQSTLPLARPAADQPAIGAAEQAGMSEAGLARVDALLQRAVADGLFPGAALAVGRRGVLVRLRGYGRLSDDADAPAVDPERTLYDLASLTKVVGTAAAAMALVDDGALELDAPLADYLAEWGTAGRNGALVGPDRGRVTIRHLLGHTAGLPAGLALHAGAASPQDAMRQIVGTDPVLVPGAVALYSDLGMILLAEALARVAGEPLDRFLARRVFRPLGMQSTLFLPPLALRAWAAPTARTAPDEWPVRGIVHDGTAFRLGGVAGHAGIFSTARDLAIFAQAILDGGARGTRRVFSPSTVAAFQQRQPGALPRALGWDTPAPESSAGSYFSERSFGHTGFTGTSLWIDPDSELFVVLLANRTYERTSLLQMLELRARVHDAVALAITDAPVTRRPGAVDVIAPPRVAPPRVAPPRR